MRTTCMHKEQEHDTLTPIIILHATEVPQHTWFHLHMTPDAVRSV